MINNFKEISIRGRLAYGVTCLEKALEQFNIKNDLIEKEVLPVIWEFTKSTDLAKWEESINKIDPLNEVSGPLKDLYGQLPSFIPEMISNVIEIGAGNLYGGTGEYSLSTLQPLKRVL